jgi:hypothetical protein
MKAGEVTTSVVSTDMNPTEGKERRNLKREGKVFPHLVDKAAFIDTIKLSVHSNRKPMLDEIIDWENCGILTSSGSNYARRIDGKWKSTGNPITILYGKVNRFKAVPPVSMIVRSESMPVTGAQIDKLVASVFPTATDVHVSLVELTFDVSSFSYPEAYRSVVYRAIHTKEFGDERNGRTFDIGSPRSLWFVSVYEKKVQDVLRVEFKLRRGFLSGRGVTRPHDLVALRTLQLSKLISFRNFSEPRIIAGTKGWSETAVDWCLRSRARRLSHVNRILCATNRADVDRLLRKSASQRLLESMQRLLVW